MKIDVIIMIVGIILLLLGGFMAPYYEARAFNECTGGNASYMTALFTELRIENCNR